MYVIEAQSYRDEEERLAADPVIIAMAAAVRDEDIPMFLAEGGNLMNVALHHAHEAGVQGIESIGGPIRAIRRLLRERQQ